MNTRLLGVLMSAAALLGAAGVLHAENAMYSCTRADGVVSLTNVPVGGHCEKLFSYTRPVAAPSAAAATPAAPQAADVAPPPAASASAPAARGETRDRSRDVAPPVGTPRSALGNRLAQRRDTARQEAADALARGQPGNVANPATTRRYLMTSRADYMQAYGVTP